MERFLSEWKLRRRKKELLRELYRWLAEGKPLGKLPNSPQNTVALERLGVRVTSVTSTGLVVNLAEQVHVVVSAYHKEVVHV